MKEKIYKIKEKLILKIEKYKNYSKKGEAGEGGLAGEGGRGGEGGDGGGGGDAADGGDGGYSGGAKICTIGRCFRRRPPDTSYGRSRAAPYAGDGSSNICISHPGRRAFPRILGAHNSGAGWSKS